MSEIDPLLRGIYYLYLNKPKPHDIKDVAAKRELITTGCDLGAFAKWEISLDDAMTFFRKKYVHELIKREMNK
jgi:hypothetical protein